MIKDIAVHCEHGQIKMIWKWSNEDITKVRILYKKKDSSEGDGTDFLSGEVMKVPHIEVGNVMKPLCGEQGLYTFTFLPYKKDGTLAEKVIVDDIMLGKRIEIIWNANEMKECTIISFQMPEGYLPAGLLTVKRMNVKCEICKEINSTTRLLFPGNIQSDRFELYIKAPYDKAYHLYQK